MPGEHRELDSLVLLVGELLLPGGLLWDGLEAASAFGVRGAGGTASCCSFAQVTGERGVVDLLEVFLNFTSGMFK